MSLIPRSQSTSDLTRIQASAELPPLRRTQSFSNLRKAVVSEEKTPELSERQKEIRRHIEDGTPIYSTSDYLNYPAMRYLLKKAMKTDGPLTTEDVKTASQLPEKRFKLTILILKIVLWIKNRFSSKFREKFEGSSEKVYEALEQFANEALAPRLTPEKAAQHEKTFFSKWREFVTKKKAATKLQAVTRGFLARKKYQPILAQAKEVKAQQATRQKKRKENAAATVIQGAFKGYLARKHHASALAEAHTTLRNLQGRQGELQGRLSSLEREQKLLQALVEAQEAYEERPQTTGGQRLAGWFGLGKAQEIEKEVQDLLKAVETAKNAITFLVTDGKEKMDLASRTTLITEARGEMQELTVRIETARQTLVTLEGTEIPASASSVPAAAMEEVVEEDAGAIMAKLRAQAGSLAEAEQASRDEAAAASAAASSAAPDELDPDAMPPAVKKMYEDLEKYVAPGLAKVWANLFKKFGYDVVESWSYSKASGSYKIKLKRPIQLWVSSEDEKGNEDPVGGLVMIYGRNKQHEIKGKLTRNNGVQTMEFSEGFEIRTSVPPRYSWVPGIGKYVTARATQLKYRSDEDIDFTAQATVAFVTKSEDRKKTVDGLLENWGEHGEVVAHDKSGTILVENDLQPGGSAPTQVKVKKGASPEELATACLEQKKKFRK